jgi:hypothetical protein
MRRFFILLAVMNLTAAAVTAQDQAPPLHTPFGSPGSNRTDPPIKTLHAQQSTSANFCPGDIAFFPTGFTFSALLPDAIYSYNTLAPVLAVVEDDVKFHDRVVLPKNTHVVGTAGTVHTLDRVNINWTLAVTPEGCEFPFFGLALSADDGSAGVKGKLEKHEDSIAATIALKSVLTGVQAAAAVAAPIEGAVTSGFSTEANQMLDQNVSKAKSLESIYVHERTPIRIFVMRRFIPDAGPR